MQPVIHGEVAPGERDSEKLMAIIQRNIPKIAEALVGDLQWYSQNAQLVPNSFKIISVENIAVDQFKMLYLFEWNLFSPCQDLNEVVTRKEQVNFHLLPGALRFEVIDNTRPSSADEL